MIIAQASLAFLFWGVIMIKQSRFFNSKTISAVSILFFILVIVIIFISNRYMGVCIEHEMTSQQNRTELRSLGERLADASDYLTDEARRFSITGKIEYFYNYWHDVCVERTRDKVISELSGYNPPNNEKNLLEAAKAYSDDLIKTEKISMKLIFLYMNKTADDYSYNKEIQRYVTDVMSTELPQEYLYLAGNEMKIKSSEILFDSSYAEFKSKIMSPIEEFQTTMNKRLDSEVNDAVHGREIASVVQICCSLSVLLLIAVLLVGIHFLYIKPINDYADILSDDGIKDNLSNKDFSKIRVTPSGAYELYRFGEIFNHLSLLLHNELKMRTKAEKEMRAARDEAHKANKAKSDFLAQMSHELRTPLNAITGYLYMLSNTVLDENQKKYCDIIELSSENLLGLINNVLDFSKIESGRMEFEISEFDLHGLLTEVISIMENTSEQKNIYLNLNTAPNLPKYVLGDSLRLRQVLINLLSNALKFTEYGGVTLSVICCSSDNEKSVIEFSVKDTGIGISKESLSRIFEPFVQDREDVVNKYGGTGLGLPISRMIVREFSKGKYDLTVNSEVNCGSEFKFFMELSNGNGDVKDRNVGREKENKFDEEYTILLVDDNEINLTIEREILKMFGLKVITASGGYQAIEYAEKYDIDMIFLDLHMPDIDGFETAKKLRLIKRCRYLPIIALTADVVSGVEESIKNSDMNDYVSKPFKPEKLCKIIEKYLNIVHSTPEILLTDGGKIFSFNECLENLNGNKEVFIKLLNRFVKNHSMDSEFIKAHIESGNYVNARKILHDIIGLSGNLCCNKLYDASVKLNDELKKNVCASLDEFQIAWNEALGEINEYLSQNEEDKKFVSSDKSFLSVWEKFISLCNDCDIAAADYFDENRELFKMEFNKAEYKRLEEYIRRYDFLSISELYKEE